MHGVYLSLGVHNLNNFTSGHNNIATYQGYIQNIQYQYIQVTGNHYRVLYVTHNLNGIPAMLQVDVTRTTQHNHGRDTL